MKKIRMNKFMKIITIVVVLVTFLNACGIKTDERETVTYKDETYTMSAEVEEAIKEYFGITDKNEMIFNTFDELGECYVDYLARSSNEANKLIIKTLNENEVGVIALDGEEAATVLNVASIKYAITEVENIDKSSLTSLLNYASGESEFNKEEIEGFLEVGKSTQALYPEAFAMLYEAVEKSVELGSAVYLDEYFEYYSTDIFLNQMLIHAQNLMLLSD